MRVTRHKTDVPVSGCRLWLGVSEARGVNGAGPITGYAPFGDVTRAFPLTPEAFGRSRNGHPGAGGVWAERLWRPLEGGNAAGVNAMRHSFGATSVGTAEIALPQGEVRGQKRATAHGISRSQILTLATGEGRQAFRGGAGTSRRGSRLLGTLRSAEKLRRIVKKKTVTSNLKGCCHR
jgi:hypothetical protein